MAHSDHSEVRSERFEDLKDITRNETEGMRVLLQLCYIPDRKDWTWQNTEELYQDVPVRNEMRGRRDTDAQMSCRPGCAYDAWLSRL